MDDNKFFKKIGLKPKIVEGDKKWQYVNGTNMKDVPITSYTNPTLINEIIEIFPDLQGDTDNARYNRELLEEIILKRFCYKQTVLGQEINDYGYKYFIIKFFDDDIDTTIFTGKDKSEALENLATQISDEIKEECLNTDWRY